MSQNITFRLDQESGLPSVLQGRPRPALQSRELVRRPPAQGPMRTLIFALDTHCLTKPLSGAFSHGRWQ
jgi:hypothetical protein